MGNELSSSEIGRMIRFYRQNAGLSQEALAELVGISFKQIQKYESGHSALNTLRLQQVASALKINVSDFFDTNAAESPGLTNLEAELLMEFRKITNAEMKDCIIKLVRNIKKRVS
ncbi:MAG: helix-turn-helix domain-containing protein [Desulfuromonadaceae bacterium]